MAVRSAGTHFSSVSLTQNDVRCHGEALLLHVFALRGRCFLFLFIGIIPDLLFDLYSWPTCMAFSLGLAAPLAYVLPIFGGRSLFEGLQSRLGGLASLGLWFGSGFCLFALLFGKL